MGLNDFVALFYGSNHHLHQQQNNNHQHQQQMSSSIVTKNNNKKHLKNNSLNNRMEVTFPLLNDSVSSEKFKNHKNFNDIIVNSKKATTTTKTITTIEENVDNKIAPYITFPHHKQQQTSCYSELDLYRTPELRKKSSFLWTSFRIPKKFKDHNRPISQSQQSQQTTTTTTSSSSSNKSKGTFHNISDNKTNLNTKIIASHLTTTTSTKASTNTTTTTVTSISTHSNCSVNNKNNNNQFQLSINENVTPLSTKDNSHPPSSPILKENQSNKKNTQQFDVNKKALFQSPHKNLQINHLKEDAIIENSTPLNDLQEEYKLKLLRKFSRNDGSGLGNGLVDSGLDFHSIYYQLLEAKKMEEEDSRQNKGIEALGVLLQYLVYDMDAFSCPKVKIDCAKAKENLCKTLNLLDEAKSTCHALQDELFEKEMFYNTREEELQALHRAELEKANVKFEELQIQTKEQIDLLKEQLELKDIENEKNLSSYRNEFESKLSIKTIKLNEAQNKEIELLQRINLLEKSEKNLKEINQKYEKNLELNIQMTKQKEKEFIDKINSLNKELECLKQTKDIRERELEDKLNLSKDEISVLRSSSSSSQNYINDSSIILPITLNVSHGSPRCSNGSNSSSSNNSNGQNGGASYEIQRLQSEAESLRCVLELKQKEISKLTKKNEELSRDADESLSLMGKISTYKSRSEMLQTELSLKTEKEKELREKYDELKKAYNHEALIRKRLSFDNEALQWQLKQRSEQLHIVEAKLHEQAILSASKVNMSSDNSINELNNSLNSSLGSLNRNNCLDRTQYQLDDLSPPSSPIIKGVIEKNDSVSWVLEMDDETPEIAASKIVKRAGSFRSVERSPLNRRCQLSMSVGYNSSGALNGSSIINGSNSNSSCNNSSSSGNGGNFGPNPLSQSMSATSVIKQHSNDAAEFLVRAHSRIRSKSVSIKSSEQITTAATTTKSSSSSSSSSSSTSAKQKILRQNSTGSNRKNDWKEPICSSSPYTRNSTNSTRCRLSSSTTRTTTTTTTTTTNNDDSSDVFISANTTCSSSNVKQQSNKKIRHHLITCDTSSLNSGEKLEMHSLPTHSSSVHDLKVLKKCQEIQESAGEAMVSGTNSEDEGCSASSDEVISTSSTTSGSSTSLNHHHNHHNHHDLHEHLNQHLRDHHHMSIEEALLLEKIQSLNGTPMEVSWSDDPDQFASESIV